MPPAASISAMCIFGEVAYHGEQVDVELVMQCVSTLAGAERALSQRADALLSAAAQDMGAQTAGVPAMRRLREALCSANSSHRAAAALKALDLARAAAAAGAASGGHGHGGLSGRPLLEACEEAFSSVASNMVGLWTALVDAVPHMAIASMRYLEATSRCSLLPLSFPELLPASTPRTCLASPPFFHSSAPPVRVPGLGIGQVSSVA